jgi:NADPH:quinone reductase-like Zn-dependent oxidoreductase
MPTSFTKFMSQPFWVIYAARPATSVKDGKLKPLIAKTFSLAEAGAALDALLSRRYAGKVVLET